MYYINKNEEKGYFGIFHPLGGRGHPLSKVKIQKQYYYKQNLKIKVIIYNFKK